jgi:hypothetical protein
MRKLTECLIVAAFLLCAFTAQAASGIDVSIPSAGEPCSNTLNCGDYEECILDVCVSTITTCVSDADCGPGFLCKALETTLCIDGEVPPSAPIDNTCTSDADCEVGTCQEVKVCTFGCSSNDDCDDGLVCDNNTGECVECLTNANCDQGVCDNTTSTCVKCLENADCAGGFCIDNNTCVECLTWTDCDNKTEICSDKDNNTCVLADVCDLKINPKKIKISKSKKITYKVFKLTVKGNNYFDPFKVDPVTGEHVINISTHKPSRDMSLNLDPNSIPLRIRATTYRWYEKKRVLEEVVGVMTNQESGFYTLRFGKCLVDVEIENKNN